MCGIAAVFAYSESAPPVDREEVLRVRDHMLSRGPDGEGLWFSDDRRVGLGHRRLSIIDLSPAGAQPMWNADRSVAIIFNGEIYNYRELRSQLVAAGYQFQSNCDTEVLLALYATRGGDAMMNELRGMYAFAIWDNTRRCLFLARDPFGIKPLYYADNGHTFRLASQVKALRAGGQIDLTPDPAGHVGFFLWGHVPDPYTMYRGVRSLPAGSTMWIDRNGVHPPKCFCNISSILADAEVGRSKLVDGGASSREPVPRDLPSSSSQLPADRLRSALAETVRFHLVADVPVGVFLSSGLDSTTIAALAAEQGGNLRTVTLGFEEYKGTAQNEAPLAEQFAKRCGAQHQTIWVSRADFEAERDHLFEAMDRPTTDGVNTFFVSLAARHANLKVALSGVGGDELFGSYPSFSDIPRTVRLLRPLAPILPGFGRQLRIVTAPVLKRLTSPKYAGTLEYGGSYGGAYLLRRGMFMPWELPEFLDADFVRAGWAELQTLLRLDETLDGIQNSRLKVSALELSWYMRHQLLRDSDWAGMGHSVEIRVPFVDVDLLREIAPLLASENPPTKRDMAGSAAPLINSEMLNRPKTGFQIPVRDWLMADVQPSTIHSQRHFGMRGLRGWATHVYRHFPGSQLTRGKIGDRRTKLEVRRSEIEDRSSAYLPTASSLRAVGSSEPEAQLPSPKNHLPSPSSHLPAVLSGKRILVFRIGQLGDTIISLPAMSVVRRNFPEAHIALLSDRHPGKSYVLAPDLLQNAGIFDEFLTYPVEDTGEISKGSRMAALLARIRRKRFDTLVYLAPTNRTPEQIGRDRRFFSFAGIGNFIGMNGFEHLEPKVPGQPMAMAPSESELLLRRLAGSGLVIRPEDKTRMDFGLRVDDDSAVLEWLRQQVTADGGRIWVAVGPGSKMPAKRWPLRRFEEVVRHLIDEFDIWPTVFGGAEDRVIGDWLLERWGRGYNAAGGLALRPSLVAMKRSVIFLGNDTGTMHMAAAVGVPCVAIFSARERPGLWYPGGIDHKVFRSQIECEGCGLVECIERQNECLKRISATDVLEACREMLATRAGTTRKEALVNA
jgi:asparagine synthase (glutamine-hydrolysing)